MTTHKRDERLLNLKDLSAKLASCRFQAAQMELAEAAAIIDNAILKVGHERNRLRRDQPE